MSEYSDMMAGYRDTSKPRDGERMNDDVLATILREIAGNCKWSTWHTLLTSAELADKLRARGVVVLPPEPTEAMFDAACETFNRAIVNWHWNEAMRQAVRAALAVLREPLDKPPSVR